MAARDLVLFGVCVLIWGTTWLAITFQLGEVSPAVSVAIRFACAGLIAAVLSAFQRQPLRQSTRAHGMLLGMGLTMFSLGYVAVYLAEERIVSALVAVGYSASPLLNQLGVRLAFGRAVDLRLTAAGLLGLVGVVGIYFPEVRAADLSWRVISGLLLTFLGVAASTVGALFAERLAQVGVPVWPKMAWSMGYGAAGAAVFGLASGGSFRVSFGPGYLGALAYLTVFGSVVAFACYLTLLDRVGSVRAGYVGVMVPVVALVVSTLFEGLRPSAWTFAGAALAIAGNTGMALLRGRSVTPRLVRA